MLTERFIGAEGDASVHVWVLRTHPATRDAVTYRLHGAPSFELSHHG